MSCLSVAYFHDYGCISYGMFWYFLVHKNPCSIHDGPWWRFHLIMWRTIIATIHEYDFKQVRVYVYIQKKKKKPHTWAKVDLSELHSCRLAFSASNFDGLTSAIAETQILRIAIKSDTDLGYSMILNPLRLQSSSGGVIFAGNRRGPIKTVGQHKKTHSHTTTILYDHGSDELYIAYNHTHIHQRLGRI